MTFLPTFAHVAPVGLAFLLLLPVIIFILKIVSKSGYKGGSHE